MPEHYDSQAGAHVSVDNAGVVRGVVQEELSPSAASSAREAADQYLREHSDLLGVAPAEVDNLARTREAAPVAAGSEFRLHGEKSQFDTTTVTYDQTLYGLPVWEAGVSVHVKEGPFRVIGADTTRHAELPTSQPRAGLGDELETLDRLDEKMDEHRLADLLGLTTTSDLYNRQSLKIDEVKLVVYRYEAAKREAVVEDDDTFEHDHPRLPLPEMPDSITEGEHYISTVVHFELGTPQFPILHWRAIIDLKTGAVLHLRPFIDGVNGLVFVLDPMTTVPSGPLPNATASALNAKRASVILEGLNAPVNNQQALSGNLVVISDVESPAVVSPIQPSGVNFDYDSRTDDFAAVNAYYHSDEFFRLVESLGFSLPAYFGPTPFPTPTDHRGFGGTGNTINAHCLGLAGGVGILQTAYALADLADTAHPIGIACDWRVVLHELGGHGILYPHVHSPNFGFSHSAGDSFAAILNDPDTAAADRFVTFPWVNIGRRHDRPVGGGWAWGGTNDVGGYNTEQILCTSHFRIYQSIGGDAALPLGHGYREFAARFMAYLILRTVGSLTQPTNPANVAGYVNGLLAADLGDWTTEGHAGGAYGKVIRWAFEKQGLFQPTGAPIPVTTAGAPPPIDVYIEDGRHGEYQFQPVHWDCHAIWNRRNADGLTSHEDPMVGVTNYAYVKIKNRGTQQANNVVVKAYSADPAAGLVYPNDWTAMTTPQLSAPAVAPNNAAEIVVGPFEWTPTAVGHQCMFMVVSASGDPSNVSNLSAGESIPEWRLVPHDNNIGQRNVTPVPFGNLEEWIKSIAELRFTLKNPLRVPAKMILKPTLPKTLTSRGWKLEFTNKGAGKPKLAAGKRIPISMKLVPGKPFTAADLMREKNPVIRIEAYANGIIIGGMTYEVAAKKR
jgi:hypothetical protein